MAAPPTAAIERSKLFNCFGSSYKVIHGHAITVDVQIPKNVKPGKHPLLVRFHGGGLVRSSLAYLKSIIMTAQRLPVRVCTWAFMLRG